jgi:hypothetical protein
MMENVIKISETPVVLTPAFCRVLASANRVARSLRGRGVNILSCRVDEEGADLVVDRNPHVGFCVADDVRVSVSLWRAAS